jgi:hypothetical protein
VTVRPALGRWRGRRLLAVATEPREDIGHGRLWIVRDLRLLHLSVASLEHLLITARAAPPEPLAPSLGERSSNAPPVGRAHRFPLRHWSDRIRVGLLHTITQSGLTAAVLSRASRGADSRSAQRRSGGGRRRRKEMRAPAPDAKRAPKERGRGTSGVLCVAARAGCYECDMPGLLILLTLVGGLAAKTVSRTRGKRGTRRSKPVRRARRVDPCGRGGKLRY